MIVKPPAKFHFPVAAIEFSQGSALFLIAKYTFLRLDQLPHFSDCKTEHRLFAAPRLLFFPRQSLFPLLYLFESFSFLTADLISSARVPRPPFLSGASSLRKDIVCFRRAWA